MSMHRFSMTLVAVILLFSKISLAGADNGVPKPAITKGQGEHCVEQTDFMRRNHMTLLRHQRDQTVLEGVRSKQHSLKECLSCHAVMGSDAMPVSATNPNHFCRSCHDYAAVNIDCFGCHSSRPESEVLPGDHDRRNGLPAAQAATGGMIGIE